MAMHNEMLMSEKSKLVNLQETIYTSKNPTRRWLHCTRRDWIADALNRVEVPSTQRALEVGPGSGIYLPVLANRFETVVASDIESAYLDNARHLLPAHPNLSLQTDDITSSALPAASFDLILCTEVVEHIVDSAAAISEMHRLLKPGGTLILSTPQRYSPLELTAKIAFLPGVIQLVRLIYREQIDETGHINLMTEKQATAQIASAGFKVHERHKSGVYLPLIAEFAGELGLKLEKWMEKSMRKGMFSGLLWTQYYVAKA